MERTLLDNEVTLYLRSATPVILSHEDKQRSELDYP